MQRWMWSMGVIAVLGCGESSPEVAPDSTPVVEAPPPDTAAARTLRDSAMATLATLLTRPETARFDSVAVMQPGPGENGRPGPVTVCGRFGGAGRTPARFVYQSRWTVFVEEAANRERFGELWARSCEDATVIIPAEGLQ